MAFLDGNRYAQEFPQFGDPLPNAGYAIHQYPAPGAADGMRGVLDPLLARFEAQFPCSTRPRSAPAGT